MRLKHFLMTVIVAVASVMLTLHFLVPAQKEAVAVARESAYEHVAKENTLRCAYYVFPPMFEFDANGKPKGMAVDVMERFSLKTGWKVEWAEEVNFGNWTLGLVTKRFDAVCAPMWPDASKAKEALFTTPWLYAAIRVYAKEGDTRFEGKREAINNPGVTVAVMEGNVTADLAGEFFPLAKQYVIPLNADYNLAIEAVRSGKADVVLWDMNGMAVYSKNNPGKMREVTGLAPMKIMPFSIPVARGEHDLKHVLDIAMEDMLNTGFIAQVVKKWELAPGSFYLPAKPYEVTE